LLRPTSSVLAPRRVPGPAGSRTCSAWRKERSSPWQFRRGQDIPAAGHPKQGCQEQHRCAGCMTAAQLRNRHRARASRTESIVCLHHGTRRAAAGRQQQREAGANRSCMVPVHSRDDLEFAGVHREKQNVPRGEDACRCRNTPEQLLMMTLLPSIRALCQMMRPAPVLCLFGDQRCPPQRKLPRSALTWGCGVPD
jgi:hypothetical protein